MVSKVDIDNGHAVYTPLLLKIYDLLVVNFSNQFIWRCPKSKLIELHQKNISANHCEAQEII